MELLAFAIAGSFGCSCSVGAGFFSSNYAGCLYNLLVVVSICECKFF